MEPETPRSICGARNRQGGPCSRPAGWGTDHPRQGRCKFHGGRARRKHGLYSKVVRADNRLPALIEKMQRDPKLGDLRAEIALVKAILRLYIEDSDPLGPADPDPGRSLITITTVCGVIGHLVERHTRLVARRGVSLEDLDRVTTEMGAHLVRVCRHVIQNEGLRQALLDQVSMAWEQIQLQPQARK